MALFDRKKIIVSLVSKYKHMKRTRVIDRLRIYCLKSQLVRFVLGFPEPDYGRFCQVDCARRIAAIHGGCWTVVDRKRSTPGYFVYRLRDDYRDERQRDRMQLHAVQPVQIVRGQGRRQQSHRYQVRKRDYYPGYW